jgi:arylsulfatase A-like enzyme
MPSTDPARPNVVVVLTDDQGFWAMGCAGNSEIRTPNLDRLARTGIRFANFFCASPVCSPARASLLTGRIPSQHGVHDWIRGGNDDGGKEKGARLIEYLKGQTGYTDILARNGYTCGMSGKWHLGDSHHPQKGFTFWEVHAGGGGPYYDAPMIVDGELAKVPWYVTDVITDNALRFLDEQKASDSPFYLSVHYTAPHSPWDRADRPAELYDDYHANCAFESTPVEPIHPWQANTAPVGRTPEARRDILSGYYAAVTAMDSGVGRIVDRLEADGLRENTVVFFTSDNGMNMGHHGIYGKGNGTFPLNMFDTSVKVPAILSRPAHVPEGKVEEGLYSHHDFMPTLLDYLGMANPEADSLPGVSFAPVLRGDDGAGLRAARAVRPRGRPRREAEPRRRGGARRARCRDEVPARGLVREIRDPRVRRDARAGHGQGPARPRRSRRGGAAGVRAGLVVRAGRRATVLRSAAGEVAFREE